ncbi:single insulin-like growth factor-binding domain protein-1 [Penaeus japonicus]|uniref:single insulin-like growth factor-binding domain protein-1 n=1 Tax=Penaeus japonicus TaxID=27405 RepID=UPI001C713138|nr:single insulin-like growth factor-binding domain protein-1 [Penaeus japonicus]
MRASLLLLVGVTVFALLYGAEAHHCGTCNLDTCPSTHDCNHGITKEHCGCCDVCLRSEGEKCDAHEDFTGICISPLVCKNGFCA